MICMGVAGWTPEQADSWLHLAGTATNYAGLYRSVVQFHPPSPEVLKSIPADFPEKSKVSPVADVMIRIDEGFDHLKLIKKAGYRTPPANPDLDPAHEALLLDELFKELLRLPTGAKQNEDFTVKMAVAEKATAALHFTLNTSPVNGSTADAAFQRVADACAGCHKAHRN